MQMMIISKREEGQRLDKYLGRLLPLAPKSFFYKMLRKKNIVLNGKKAEGMERLNEGDEIKLFLADETIAKFWQEQRTDKYDGEKGNDKIEEKNRKKEKDREHEKYQIVSEIEKQENLQERPQKKKQNLMESLSEIPIEFSVAYEDEHILIMNKPVGLLSQKSKEEDISLIEQMTAYLIQTGKLTIEEWKLFHPGICNRLDRNTSGLVIGGKTTKGLQEMNVLLKERTLDKYYLTIVSGIMKKGLRAEGYLKKDTSHNRVTITKEPVDGADYICTEYEPLAWKDGFSLIKVKLVTGKSHQIRAHLKSLGYPVIGDGKYGDVHRNKELRRRFSLKNHLLHAYEIRFPKLTGVLTELSQKSVYAEPDAMFLKIMKAMFPEYVLK